MLDQNTDRMWYVIGAVIVGAAIILIMNGTMPQIFASVADNFEEATSKGTDAIDGLYDVNLVAPSSATEGIWVVEGTGETSTTSSGEYWASTDYMPVQSNTSYTFKSPNTMYNMRIVYFDKDKTYIGGVREYHVDALAMESPENAAYVRISAPFTYYDESAPVAQWWFSKTSELDEYAAFAEEVR